MYVSKEMTSKARYADLYRFCIDNHADLFEPAGGTYIRLKDNHPIKISSAGYGYVDFKNGGEINDKATHTSCNPIDFLQRFLNYTFPQAVEALQPYTVGSSTPLNPTNQINTTWAKPYFVKTNIDTQRDFIAPAKAENNNKIIEYLNKVRNISVQTIKYLIDEHLLYQSKEHSNCVFKYMNYAEIRGTYDVKPFKSIAPGSAHAGFWGFRMTEDKSTVYICESAIDAISLYELNQMNPLLSPGVFVSIGGCGKKDTIKRIASFKCVKKIIIAFDSDEAADKAYQAVKNIPKVIKRIKSCQFKDWNEFLKSKK